MKEDTEEYMNAAAKSDQGQVNDQAAQWLLTKSKEESVSFLVYFLLICVQAMVGY